MCCMLVSPLYTKFPYHRAKLQYTGVSLCALGLLTSGFATAPWQVLVTIGIVYPLGGALYYFPVRLHLLGATLSTIYGKANNLN